MIDAMPNLRIGKGRRRIFDDREITKDNIIQILFDALNIHRLNVSDMQFLLDYYKGQQNILKRQAPSTSDINNRVVLNYAHSSIRDIIGYTFGKPIQFVPRKTKYKKEIEKLSDIFEYENASTTDNEVATFAGICGIGYLCTLPSKELSSENMPDIPISINNLDVLSTFVIQSSSIGHPVRLSCTYWTDKKFTYFTVFTDTQIFYIKSTGNGTLSHTRNEVIEDVNILGLNPIQMVENNNFLMGDFEVAISVLDALNQIASDSVNDVENVIKSLLVIINSELDDKTENVKKNRVLELLGAPGANVDAKFLYQQIDSLGIGNLREYLEEAYKTIIGIPDRKTRGGGGGDTGDAVKLRDGWADIEIVARIKENYFKMAKKKQLAVAIKILQLLGLIKHNLKTIDIDVKFSRNKNDNLQVKAQAFSTLHSTRALDPTDSLEMCDLTTDVVDVAKRGEKYWEQKENVQKETNNPNDENPDDNNSNNDNNTDKNTNDNNDDKNNKKEQ